MITKEQKQKIIDKNKTKKSDVGSIPVQIALLTKDIEDITNHLAKNKMDFTAKKNLLFKVKKRTSFLNYIKKNDISLYKEIKTKNKIRR